jgi:hypothetical protein
MPIPGYEGLYEVSDLGHVYSFPRWRLDRWGTSRLYGKGGLLKPGRNPGGYRKVDLYKDGKAATLNVAALVLLPFVGPCPTGHATSPRDGNQNNDTLHNLCWGTKSQNTLDQVRHGTHWEARMTECPRCGSELTRRPNGHRYCVPCSRAQNREWCRHNRRGGLADT